MLLATWAAVGVAGVQAYMFNRQLNMMAADSEANDQSAKSTLDNAKAMLENARQIRQDQRAWLAYSKIDYEDHYDSEKRYTGTSFFFVWTNSGKTPAIECELWSNVEYTKPGGPLRRVDMPNVKGGIAKPFIVPGAHFPSNGLIVPPQAMADFKAGRVLLVLVGRAKYKDTFSNEQHLTEATLFIQANGTRDGKQRYLFVPIGAQNSVT